MRALLVFFTITLVAMLFLSSATFCQVPLVAKAETPPTIFEGVVDRVFQFSSGEPGEFANFKYRIVLRFLPSLGRESQLVFLGREDKTIRIIQFGLMPGAPPLSEQYTNILDKNLKADVNDITREIAIERKERVAKGTEAGLVLEFFRLSIPTNLSTDACLDGTIYQLWVQTPSNKIFVSLSDCAYNENTESNPMIQWIKSVRRELEK